MIFTDFAKALGQWSDPKFRRVVFIGLGLAIALLFGIYAFFVGMIGWFLPGTLTLPWVGEVTWLHDLLSWGSILIMVVMSMFLMVPVASAFTGLFLDDVAVAVEKRHYSHLPQPPRIPFREALQDSLNFLGLMVVANLFALILYAIFNIFAPVIFWSLNGFLLGREYFQMVAMRRIGRTAARQLWRQNGLQIWLAGALMAMPLSIPIVNLFVPVFGVATFTHLFHRISRDHS
ncbi:EI24 domain-containing protein [Cochlodiniinecator piscidefendens]|uniref:EI24 domain-containing protein n=1 Tax=Cochlodiniinecator piscidefendens TaxID=2715756 RepID=UPI00140A62CE|nr:EI24 domain-containing protein [Cochlodiniinecator piscidefendens]